ncbi:hypothetical protein SCHPADRAFT_859201 [Schizopora paradoxa]|uniref:rRNA-processing protein EFG1 n=1 Tax=Schizopora paradoxa TaxID=27342 RepID=A0A0H2RTV3_9AGAM|nr:hypothetical protein SCHPADRAFT_859201 [Schizopora paradoxa]
MPPSRGKASSSKATNEGESSKGIKKQFRKKSTHEQTNDELPGVQKLKSALRQTRRLLAKDNLDADVRVQTERRLKSLEGDLQLAETKRKERAMATKYHKVKFFERKKITRKIAQIKREIESGSPASSKAVANLEKTLFDLRVDMNYILHYPKLEKYIALFPAQADSDEPPANDETNGKRERMREDIKARMQSGELHGEPELQTVEEKSAQTKSSQARPSERKECGGKKSKKDTSKESTAGGGADGSVGGDDFFEVDNDSSASASE